VVSRAILVAETAIFVFVLQIPKPNTPLGTSIDRGPYVNVTEDGMVAALNNELKNDNTEEIQVMQDTHNEGLKMIPEEVKRDELETNAKTVGSPAIAQIGSAQDATANVMRPFKIYLGQLSRQNQWSIWLLVYIAITTSWPLVGSALYIVFGKKIRNILPNGLLRR